MSSPPLGYTMLLPPLRCRGIAEAAPLHFLMSNSVSLNLSLLFYLVVILMAVRY
ncbi:hypothetical protein Hanom_Chr10g00955771 [Helianthus anomalus]